jgi:hypothetical protein
LFRHTTKALSLPFEGGGNMTAHHVVYGRETISCRAMPTLRPALAVFVLAMAGCRGKLMSTAELR